MSKLSALRQELAARDLDGFIVPRTDEYQGEYLPACAERVAWLSGFTGSAGAVIVLKDKAVVMSDGRYTEQLPLQVDQAEFQIANTGVTSPVKWLSANAASGAKIGYDPKLHTVDEVADMRRKFRQHNIEIVPQDTNPIDAVWTSRPPPPASPVEIFPDSIAGRSAADKRELVARTVVENGGSAVVIALPESVAWLLNIRGNDVPHTPVALSQAIMYENGDVDWFITPSRVSAEVNAHLGNHVRVRDPVELEHALMTLGQQAAQTGKAVLMDGKRTPIWFANFVRQVGGQTDTIEDPCLMPRACKTEAEQKSIIAAHVIDGVAVTRFLHWFEAEAPHGRLDELAVVAKLREFREKSPDFRDDSFDTISGWAGHGAIVHYRADAKSNAAITPPGILLLDSGAQYQAGTTDITRTVTVGTPDEDVRDNYTRVLKGHIGVAMAKFEEGTPGATVDGYARNALWQAGLGFSHGTGHGVGCYLSVHEPAASISLRGFVPFKPGMLISNEPGYYKKDAYGIRLENLVLVKETGVRQDTVGSGDEKKMMAFETVTIVPFDRRLIRPEMLNAGESAWLDSYHERVYQTLAPHLEADVKTWLRQATEPLKKNQPGVTAQAFPQSPAP